MYYLFLPILFYSLYNLISRIINDHEIFKTFVEYNPRRDESIVRRVIFKNLENSVNKLSHENRTELYWFVYSLSMPAYEKSIAKLDTFEDNFVLKQEYEHSRVHAKLNHSYEKSMDNSSLLYKMTQIFKCIWRIYFSIIPIKDIMILGEIYLGFNIFDIRGRLNAYKYLPMSEDMRKVLVYHELEEIEHGLDLVPRISNKNTFWRICLAAMYSVHYTFYTFMMELQTICFELVCKNEFDINKLYPLVEFILDPLHSVDPKICYAVIFNKYPTRKYRDDSEKLYKKCALEMFKLDFTYKNIFI